MAYEESGGSSRTIKGLAIRTTKDAKRAADRAALHAHWAEVDERLAFGDLLDDTAPTTGPRAVP